MLTWIIVISSIFTWFVAGAFAGRLTWNRICQGYLQRVHRTPTRPDGDDLFAIIPSILFPPVAFFVHFLLWIVKVITTPATPTHRKEERKEEERRLSRIAAELEGKRPALDSESYYPSRMEDFDKYGNRYDRDYDHY